jgi:ubiquitin carboxyl-terminal hydrolase 9/13
LAKNKKDEPQLDLTPVEKLLHNAGPIREDGSDKFFGLENVRVPKTVTI